MLLYKSEFDRPHLVMAFLLTEVKSSLLLQEERENKYVPPLFLSFLSFEFISLQPSAMGASLEGACLLFITTYRHGFGPER